MSITSGPARSGAAGFTGGTIVGSSVRFLAAAIAVTAGFSYVLEAEDQFKRTTWYGLVFAALTGAWFIIGSFLATVDTVSVYRTLIAVAVGAFLLWAAGYAVPVPEGIDDVGSLAEPLTRLRLVLATASLVIAVAVLVTLGRRTPAMAGPAHRTARTVGLLALVVGLIGVVLTARSQSFFDAEPGTRSLGPPSAASAM